MPEIEKFVKHGPQEIAFNYNTKNTTRTIANFIYLVTMKMILFNSIKICNNSANAGHLPISNLCTELSFKELTIFDEHSIKK